MGLRPVFLIIGHVLTILAGSMFVPALVDRLVGNPDWRVFALSATLTMFAGVGLVLASRGQGMRLSLRQGFLMATLIWLVLPLFAALPFHYSVLRLTFTDAFFEAMSGITTTGSTVITGLESLPPGILLWRAILQWLGGLGIIVMGISVLPMLRVGGMQLFRIEAFETEGKARPRAAEISSGITAIYLTLTALWAVMLWAAGMSGFEAVTHAMTTLATGGYSTSDQSIGHFNSATIDVIVTAGMVIGGIPFILFLRFVEGDFRPLLYDSQVRWYLALLLSGALVVAVWLWWMDGTALSQALRFASFTVVSIMTGTGYASIDYGTWGTFPLGIVFFLTFVGGCAGSTACGMKVFRFQVLFAIARSQIHRLFRPHAIHVPRYNRRPISDDVVMSVLSFFFLFGLCFALLSIGLTFTGLDLVTALSGAATAMANVGPGLGPIIGPSGNFAVLPDLAKWLLAAGMLIGRLEVFTVVVLFTPAFWRAGF